MTSRAWQRATEAALSRAEELAMSAGGGEFPIRLAEIAKALSVQVEFRLVPCDAIIGRKKSDGKLKIYLNCAEPEVTKFNTLLETAPEALPARIRFSLAHELAHVLFLSQGKCETEDDLRYVEQGCNRTAAQMLLPETPLRQEATRKNLLNPVHLREIVIQASVSPEAFIYRLKPFGRFVNEVAAIGVIRDNGNGFEFDPITAHDGITTFFPKLKAHVLCREILQESDFCWNGGRKTSFTQRGQKSWTYECEPITANGEFSRYFATIYQEI